MMLVRAALEHMDRAALIALARQQARVEALSGESSPPLPPRLPAFVKPACPARRQGILR